MLIDFSLLVPEFLLAGLGFLVLAVDLVVRDRQRNLVASSLAAVGLGATIIERHITLDRSMWGSDQAASVEPQGLQRLVRDVRTIQVALGDGVKCVYESEKPIREKLRRVG